MRVVASVIALGLVASAAHADPQTAKQLAGEAEALAGKGDLVGAAGKFRAAFAEDPRPEYICNVGVAYHKAKDLPRTHRYLGQCVAMGSSLDPAYRENLRKVVEATEAKLVAGNFTPVDFALSPGTATVSIDGGAMTGETLVGAGRLWFPYGAYRLQIAAAGHVDKVVELEARAHAARPMRIALEQAITVEPPPNDTKPVEPVPPEDPRPIVPAPAPVAPSKVAAVIVTAGTAVAGIAAALLYGKARIYVNDAESAMSSDAFDELHGKAHDFQRLSWIAGGVAGLGAIASGVLWYRALRSPARVEVHASGDGAGVSISGAF